MVCCLPSIQQLLSIWYCFSVFYRYIPLDTQANGSINGGWLQLYSSWINTPHHKSPTKIYKIKQDSLSFVYMEQIRNGFEKQAHHCVDKPSTNQKTIINRRLGTDKAKEAYAKQVCVWKLECFSRPQNITDYRGWMQIKKLPHLVVHMTLFD